MVPIPLFLDLGWKGSWSIFDEVSSTQLLLSLMSVFDCFGEVFVFFFLFLFFGCVHFYV
jgi:hypothetical protein